MTETVLVIDYLMSETEYGEPFEGRMVLPSAHFDPQPHLTPTLCRKDQMTSEAPFQA